MREGFFVPVRLVERNLFFQLQEKINSEIQNAGQKMGLLESGPDFSHKSPKEGDSEGSEMTEEHPKLVEKDFSEQDNRSSISRQKNGKKQKF